MSEWAMNAAAFLSLALTQRRLSWGYRRLANEDAEQGDGYQYSQNVAEARRLWRAAKDSLSWARHHRDLGARHGA